MTRRNVCLITAAVAVLVVCGLRAPAVSSAPVSARIPAGFRAASIDALNTRDWWLAGTVPCGFRHPCLALVRTLNGGRGFARVHVPTIEDVGANSYPQVAFADLNDGFVAGARLWVTHDGGRHWHVDNLGAPVQSVAAGGGFVYVTVWNRSRGFLMRSPAKRDDWTTLAEGGPYFEDVSVDDGVVLADREVNAGGTQEILISHDQGATFSSSQPVPETYCNPLEPTPDVVWMLCRGGMMDGLYRSTDGGRTFVAPRGPTYGSQNPSGVWPGGSSLAAATGTTAVIGFGQLFRTTDGGNVYRRVALPVATGGWEVTFMNARDGLALGKFGDTPDPVSRLYYTSDAGASYHLVALR